MNPIITVAVILYNSEKYVLETLESVKNQDYNKIQLVISDDSSTDNTLEICENWLEKNKSIFINPQLIKAEKNSGIPANANRATQHADGKWLKLIAGDDILDSECISSFWKFSELNNEIKIISSITQPFVNCFDKKNFRKEIRGNRTFNDPNITAQEQYRMLLLRCLLHSPNVIINTDLIKSLGGFDEKYWFMEDYPFWLKATKNNYKIHFMEKVTVFYRVHSESIYNKDKNNKLFNDFYILKMPFEEEYIYPFLSKPEILMLKFEYYRNRVFDILKINKNCLVLKFIYLFFVLTSPLNLWFWLKFNKIRKNS